MHFPIIPWLTKLQKPLINALLLISHKIIESLFSLFIKYIHYEEDYQNYRMIK